MYKIAHGGGGNKSKKLKRSNSIECFIHNYNHGVRVFEFDLMYTKDHYIIVTHEFEEYDGVNHLLLSEYRELNKELLVFDDLIKLLDEYKDIVLYLDTKEEDLNVIKMYQYINNNYPSYINRIIPQVYSVSSFNKLKDTSYKTFIFAIYKSSIKIKDIIAFMNKNTNILGICASKYDKRTYYLLLFSKLNILVYTVNNKLLKLLFKLLNAKALYSDYNER